MVGGGRPSMGICLSSHIMSRMFRIQKNLDLKCVDWRANSGRIGQDSQIFQKMPRMTLERKEMIIIFFC